MRRDAQAAATTLTTAAAPQPDADVQHQQSADGDKRRAARAGIEFAQHLRMNREAGCTGNRQQQARDHKEQCDQRADAFAPVALTPGAQATCIETI